MGRATLYELTDRQYIRLDGGNRMAGQLQLVGDPQADNDAVRKAYLDTVFGAAPTDADIAAAILVLTTGGGTIDARIAAAVAAYLPLAGGTLTGALTLSGAPINNLHAATKAYADLMLPLAGGTMGGVLTLAADPLLAMQSATKQYVDAIPPGQPVFDAVVDAAGGADYTSVATACATEAIGAKIYVVRGTYNETANIAMKDGQMLEGQNPEDTIIDFGGGAFKITPNGVGSNRSVINLTIQASIANITVEMAGTGDRVTNCIINGTVASGTAVYLGGIYSIVSHCIITGFTAVGAYGVDMTANSCICHDNTIVTCRTGIDMQGVWCVVSGNRLAGMTLVEIETGAYGQVVGNSFSSAAVDVLVSGAGCVITGNYIRGDVSWAGALDFITISDNDFNQGGVINTQVNVDSCNINGNHFNDGSGIRWAGRASTLNGNSFKGTAYFEFTAGADNNTAIGNNLNGSTEANATRFTDLGLSGNTAMFNSGVPHPAERRFVGAQNWSGVGVVDGDVVIHESEASGNRVKMTTTQGDPLVAGVFNAAVANGAWGAMQNAGKIATLKVNGTVDIAIGDLLGTYPAAGISMKAATGDMAFAIALEVYAVDDSAGVIDALLIEPRLVPAHNYAGMLAVDQAVATVIDLVDHYVPITIYTADMPETVSSAAFGTYNITVGEDGVYKIEFHATTESAGAAKTYSSMGFAITPTAQAITAATQANPCQITAVGHSFLLGQHVKLSGIGGMVELNDKIYTVFNPLANTFELHDENAAGINSGAYGVYTANGVAELATEIDVLHSHRLYGAGGDEGSESAGGLAVLVAGETIEMHVMNLTDATDMTVSDIQFSVVKM